MRWIEASIQTKSEDIDELCERLAALDVGGFVIEDEADFKDFLENNRQYWDYVDEELENRFAGASRIKFYLSDDADGKAILENIRRETGIVPDIAYIEDSDWENNWKEYYQPLEIGEKLLIVPEWLSPDTAGRTALRLDPGLIFGTGSHATTRMCLCQVEKYARPGTRALDLGCGSGILGIGALLCGCDYVAGCDVDPKAPDVACANAALNGIEKSNFRILAGDIISDESLRNELGSGYDLVLANIVADVIIPLTPHVPQFMAPDGIYVCSGIIEGRQDEIENVLSISGFEILAHDCQEDWHCYVSRLK